LPALQSASRWQAAAQAPAAVGFGLAPLEQYGAAEVGQAVAPPAPKLLAQEAQPPGPRVQTGVAPAHWLEAEHGSQRPAFAPLVTHLPVRQLVSPRQGPSPLFRPHMWSVGSQTPKPFVAVLSVQDAPEVQGLPGGRPQCPLEQMFEAHCSSAEQDATGSLGCLGVQEPLAPALLQ
jgi:hypothetical protein